MFCYKKYFEYMIAYRDCPIHWLQLYVYRESDIVAVRFQHYNHLMRYRYCPLRWLELHAMKVAVEINENPFIIFTEQGTVDLANTGD